MLHQIASELSGKTVKIKVGATHLQVPTFGGSEIRIEDWWDRVSGKPWGICQGNPACIVYALRSVENKLPLDNQVLYGKIGALGHLVHLNELELEEVQEE